MADSDSSALSSPPASDDELLEPISSLIAKAKPSSDHEDSSTSIAEPSPARKKRPASPPHEDVLADNPDIAFIVMFRSRFSDAFPPKTPHLGPQDIERGVVDQLPSPQVESLLCALLGLVLNRKKPVERGHYNRALEEAIQTQKSQWPKSWNSVNPLHGSRTFNSMTPNERLNLLKTLILWCLNASDAVSSIIKESHKQSRHDNDLNQPLSVQPWGTDGDKRRYWLVEGRDDTCFRLYRESNPKLKTNTWWSVAGSIEELRTLSDKLSDEGSQAARRLSERIINAISRFEATEEKRKRREYRLARKAQFARPEPGFSLYEGRTRGKRMKYTFSDEEEETSDALSTRRSTRYSGQGMQSDPGRPTVTASGRQVRTRQGGLYGESLLSGQSTVDRVSPVTGDYEQSDISDDPRPTHGRSTRANASSTINGWKKGHKHIEGYNSLDEMDDEDDASSSGNDWSGDDDDNDGDDNMDLDVEEDDMSDEAFGDTGYSRTKPKPSLIVTLRYRARSQINSNSPNIQDEITVRPTISTTINNLPVHPVPTGLETPNGIQNQEVSQSSTVSNDQVYGISAGKSQVSITPIIDSDHAAAPHTFKSTAQGQEFQSSDPTVPVAPVV